MSDILVVNPLTNRTKNVVRDVVYGCWCKGKRIGGASVPPFALLQIASSLQAAGFDALFLDAQAEQRVVRDYAHKLRGIKLIILSTSTMSFTDDVEYIREIKALAPGAKAAVFGSQPTFMPESVLAEPDVDFAIRHEPYFAAVALAKALLGDGSLDETPNLSRRGANGALVSTPEVLETNLDSLPIPNVELLPKGVDYFNPIVKRQPYITTTTSWGCPGKCAFCTAPAFDGPRVRFKSAEYVVNELEHYAKKGFKEIYFRDDTFFVKPKRERAIFAGMKARGLDLTWLANARVGMIDEAMLADAKAAGCHNIKFGIESGVQEILDRSRKGYKVQDAVTTFAAARRVGVDTHAHVMLGMPGETRETMERTIDYVVEELKPSTATFGICTPYPGTPLFEEVRKAHPEIGDGTAVNLDNLHLDGFYNQFYTSLQPEELGQAVRHAYRRFYARPGYILGWLGKLQSKNDLRRTTIAATKIFDFCFRGE